MALYSSLLCALLLAGAAQPVLAQPDALPPVRLVVSLPPGGSLDVIARKLGPLMAAGWGQVPVIENKVGAGGTIAADYVAKAPAGSVPLLVSAASTFTIVPHVFPRLPYDQDRDLTPLVQIGTTPFVLLVRENDAAADLKALLQRARDHPASVSFGSFGNGSVTHVIGESVNAAAGVKMLHVPYRGTVPAITDLLGGQVTAVVSDLGTARPFLNGRLRALAITGSARHPSLPDVPTFGQQGLPALDGYISWVGIFAPGTLPRTMASRLADDLSRALRSDAMKAELAAIGFDATGTSGESFAVIVQRDRQRWSQVLRDIGGISFN